jgi:GLPGLI family protein
MTFEQQLSIGLKYPASIDNVIEGNLKTNTIQYSEFVVGAGSISPRYSEVIKNDWKLINETKVINNINCSKATRKLFGRSWTAWYSTSIALPYGPNKFFGLPGLIIKVEDETKSYSYELLSVIKRDVLRPVEVYENIKKMTKKEAVKIYDNNRFLISPSARIMEPDLQKIVQQRIEEKRKNYNNPIELKPFDYQ